MGAASEPPAPRPTPDLDLAFEADPELPAALRQAAGPWADPLQGAEPWHGLISAWLVALTDDLPAALQAPAYSLGLSLVGDEEIAALNAEWRQKPGATDVLAFAAQDNGLDQAPAMPMPAWGGEDGEDGEPEPLERELLFLASHGLLHLLGWDHPDDASLAAMLARQEQLLATTDRR
jgi:probable rRNA maturation factor